MEANTAIDRHNYTINNLAQSQRSLSDQVWQFIVTERQTDLETFRRTSTELQKEIDGLLANIATKEQNRDQLKKQLKEREERITSTKPTVDAINKILSSFGFRNFSLAVVGDHENMYQILRSDGSEAGQTLSEGERSFITFLYFYHMLDGSLSGTGTTADKVVVFDDPVSSLDSDVLFVVSALIRKVVSDIRNGKGSVRQVFVLTHNIYFHKQVSFEVKRPVSACLSDETFWIVRKRKNFSSIQHYTSNPVKTSYELLWEEVKHFDNANLTIQNTLRRILENYFLVLGGLRYEDIFGHFVGSPDAQVCASLLSWIHDGSHSAYDELYLADDDNAVQSYLRVFRQVFEKTGHIAHYNMMMGIGTAEEAGQPEEKVSPAISETVSLIQDTPA